MNPADEIRRAQVMEDRYHRVNPYYKPVRASNQRGMLNLMWLLLIPALAMYFYIALHTALDGGVGAELTQMTLAAILLFFIAWFGIYIFKLRRGGQAAFIIIVVLAAAFFLRNLALFGFYTVGEAPGAHGGQWLTGYNWGGWAATYSVLLHPARLAGMFTNPSAHFDLSVYGGLAGSLQWIWLLEFVVTLIVVLQATRRCGRMFIDDYGAWATRRRTRAKLRFVRLDEYKTVKTGLENSDFSVIYNRPEARGADPENYAALYTYRVRGVNTGYISLSNIHLRKYNSNRKYWFRRETVVAPPIFITGGQSENLIRYLDTRDRAALDELQFYGERNGPRRPVSRRRPANPAPKGVPAEAAALPQPEIEPPALPQEESIPEPAAVEAVSGEVKAEEAAVDPAVDGAESPLEEKPDEAPAPNAAAEAESGGEAAEAAEMEKPADGGME